MLEQLMLANNISVHHGIKLCRPIKQEASNAVNVCVPSLWETDLIAQMDNFTEWEAFSGVDMCFFTSWEADHNAYLRTHTKWEVDIGSDGCFF